MSEEKTRVTKPYDEPAPEAAAAAPKGSVKKTPPKPPASEPPKDAEHESDGAGGTFIGIGGGVRVRRSDA